MHTDRMPTETLENETADWARSQRSVLVVDDEVALSRSLQRVLERAGYEVLVAASGTAAVEMVMQRPFDVVLSDIQMPGMTGVDLLSVVRAYDLDVPVILMTAEPKVESAIDAVALGAFQYLIKPIDNDKLLVAIEKASRLHRMAGMKRRAFRLLEEEGARAGDLVGLGRSFDRALETMWIAFQPIVDSAQRRIYGYEALMRNNEGSLPDPGAVLAAAEQLDRLPELGRRVRRLSAQGFAARRAMCCSS